MSVHFLYPDLIYCKQCATNWNFSGSIPHWVFWSWSWLTPNTNEYYWYLLGHNAASA